MSGRPNVCHTVAAENILEKSWKIISRKEWEPWFSHCSLRHAVAANHVSLQSDDNIMHSPAGFRQGS